MLAAINTVAIVGLLVFIINTYRASEEGYFNNFREIKEQGLRIECLEGKKESCR